MNKKKILISLVATTILFTACGGGDGGGGTTPPPSPNVGNKPVFVTTSDTRKVISGMRNSISISLGEFLYDVDDGELYTFEASVDPTSDITSGYNLSITGMGVLKFKSPASGNFSITVKATEKKTKAAESHVLSFETVEANSVNVTRTIIQTGVTDGGSGISRSFSKADQYANVIGVNSLTWTDLDSNVPNENGPGGTLGETYLTAYDYCRNLTENGGNWRLPTIDELLDTVNYDKDIDLSIESNRLYDDAFSIDLLTSWANETSNGDKYYLHNGGGTINPANNGTFRTRCVQGSVQPSEHIIYTDTIGVSHDLSTGLQWSKADVVNTMTVSEASGYCSSKGTEWRLPSINELRSVVQAGSISSYISGGQTMMVSSTPYKDTDNSTSLSWGIYLNADVTTTVAAMQDASQYAISCVAPIN